jgi:hypothetical protein
MHDGDDSLEMINGVPVVAAPAEIDVTTAEQLRSVLLEAASHGHTTIVGKRRAKPAWRRR